jgi:hypothetical protein
VGLVIDLAAFLVCLLAAILIVWLARGEKHDSVRELRRHEGDLDIASGRYMRFRRAAEFDPQDRERVGL